MGICTCLDAPSWRTARLDIRACLTCRQVCDPDTPAGNWITHLDVVEDGSKLKVSAPTGPLPRCIRRESCSLDSQLPCGS